jgi:Flp pilus assembly protein TadD
VGNLDQAIVAFNKAIALVETAAEMRSVLGNAYFKKGMLDEAIEQYKKALALNPNLRGARNNLKAAEEEKAGKR